ncbi:MAG: hypothetical protein JWR19_4334, partial [Pedosphaera sp.]|nr:hypothetical protein [Pedosphaera sp.]
AFQSETAPVVIGVVGESPMGPELHRSIMGKTVNGRALEVRQIGSLGELKNCQMVFICSSEKKRLPEILKAVGDASVLTVGETDNFTEAGGMINLVREGNKVRFEINDNAARRVRLKISSKLLSLARKKGGA